MTVLTERDKETIRSRFLDRMTALYGPPYHLKEAEKMKLALGEYMEALNRFSASELDAGWERLRESYTGKTWPSVQECVGACKPAYEPRRQEQSGGATVAEVMRSAMGQAAIKGGYANELRVIVEGGGRWPTEKEVAKAQREAAARHDKTRRLIEDMKAAPERYVAARFLISLGQGILEKEAELARLYGGEEVVL